MLILKFELNQTLYVVLSIIFNDKNSSVNHILTSNLETSKFANKLETSCEADNSKIYTKNSSFESQPIYNSSYSSNSKENHNNRAYSPSPAKSANSNMTQEQKSMFLASLLSSGSGVSQIKPTTILI